MKCLITGGCGFLGTNLANEALGRGYDLAILDNLSRYGSEQNRQWLEEKGKFDFVKADVSEREGVERIVKALKPTVIFHLAGQVAMTTSIQDPRRDFETNAVGSLNVLEAVRKFSPNSIIVYSSTNKVYGDLEFVQYEETDTRYRALDYAEGFDEGTPLAFHSPYGCSKGAVDQYMLDYSRIYGLNTLVFRHSTIFGGRQFSTFDQGWIGWFIQKSIEFKKGIRDPFTISGNGKQVRDILFASDLVSCYFGAVESIERSKGHAFNMGGGMENSLSILELLCFLQKELSVELEWKYLPWRQSDQKVFVANIKKANQFFGWRPKVNKEQGLREMIRWVQDHGPH
jgi:CDP-paratose 2-epimerase